MTLLDINQAIESAVMERLPAALLDKAPSMHKRHWRTCGCEWCDTKQRATAIIANVRSGDRELRKDRREDLRDEFRRALKNAEAKEPSW